VKDYEMVIGSPDAKALTILARSFAGKRLLRSEIPLPESLFQKLVDDHLFVPFPSIKKHLFSHQCQRCYNRKRSYFGEMPCARCKERHVYCRSCIAMGRIGLCEPLYEWAGPEPEWPLREGLLTWQGRLTDLQLEAAEKAVLAVNTEQTELLLWAVCGAGKTEMLYPCVASALENGKRVCLASPRADVIRELLPRFKEAFAAADIEALYGGSPDKQAKSQLILATTHQLLRFHKAFDVLIIDEVDAFPYHGDPLLPLAAIRARKDFCTVLYLTATPRPEHKKRIQRKNLPHHFIPCRFHGHPLPVPKNILCASLKKHIHKSLLPPRLFIWIEQRCHDRQLLLFVPTIQLAEQMKTVLAPILLEKNLIGSFSEFAVVHSKDPDREEKVQAFRCKDIQFLICTTILERGVTFPSVDVVVLDAGHEVFDEAALVQIAGRAGRSPNDPDGHVLFFHDGRTEAMNGAIQLIKAMNKRAGFLP